MWKKKNHVYRYANSTAEIILKIHTVKSEADFKFSWRFRDVMLFSLVDKYQRLWGMRCLCLQEERHILPWRLRRHFVQKRVYLPKYKTSYPKQQ